MQNLLSYIVKNALKNKLSSTEEVLTLKRAATKKFKVSKMPLNSEILTCYHQMVEKNLIKKSIAFEKLLTTRKIRSLSGVAVVTVLTKPYPCPGKCIYCPSEQKMPKSYLSNEPAAMRAVANKFDPYKQVTSRLAALKATGHPTDKIELIILGGTFSAYPKKYQSWFIRRCFQAANEANVIARHTFTEFILSEANVLSAGSVPKQSRRNWLKHGIASSPFASFRAPRNDKEETFKQSYLLKNVQKQNEKTKHRIIGITIETRPDWINENQIKWLRYLGVTRVELGIQTIYNDILKINQRGHSIRETIYATRLLKDAGFKVNYHIMPNLPGSDLKRDFEMFKEIFTNSDFQPDILKIYPTVVVKTSKLYKWWRRKKYKPYSDRDLVKLLISIKKIIPLYVRIMRLVRDIPSPSIIAGTKISNLRQILAAELKVRDEKCRCIRCREIKNLAFSPKSLVLRRIDYDGSRGKEIFLSYEDKKQDKILALLRLRIPSQIFTHKKHFLSVLENAAIIRELHTYGKLVPIAKKSKRAAQHIGLGRRLISEAENIVKQEFNIKKIAVISGVGARDYYRKLGYRLKNEYMIKFI